MVEKSFFLSARKLKRLIKLTTKLVICHFKKNQSPFKLNFVVTKECHSKCQHCSIWQETKFGDLSLNDIQSFFKKNSYFQWVDITGGEPTDHPNFSEVVKIICQNSPDLYFLHFPTNGINTKRIIKKTKEILDFNQPIKLIITVSIDGPPLINDKLRGIIGDYSRSIQTYRELKKIKEVDCYIGMTLFQENASKIPETLESLKKDIPGFSVDDLHINLGHHSEHYYANSHESKPADINNYLKDFVKFKKRKTNVFSLIEVIFLKKLTQYLATNKSPLPCQAMRNSIYLSENGDLYPCSIWNKKIGNIKGGVNLKETLLTNQAMQIKNQIEKLDCPNCWTPCEAFPSMSSKLIPSLIREVLSD